MAETKSLLKTRTYKIGTVGSNPTFSAILLFINIVTAIVNYRNLRLLKAYPQDRESRKYSRFFESL